MSEQVKKQMSVEVQIKGTKRLRKGLDAQLQELKALPKTRETSLAITKLQESIMWLGMNLKGLNEPNPYPSSYDDTTATVEPTADGLKL